MVAVGVMSGVAQTRTIHRSFVNGYPAGVAGASDVIRVVDEPRRVTTVSSKSESAWAECEWCRGKISYTRTFDRNVYDNCWVETTKDKPSLCRACGKKRDARQKLADKEAELDRKLEDKAAKRRIRAKKEMLRE